MNVISPESGFNVLHFCGRLYMPVTIVCGLVIDSREILHKPRKIPKTPYVGTRSSKVIEFNTNGTGVHRFLLLGRPT